MTHTQIKAIASQIARRVQAGLARRPRVNIKTLAAALALTVVGAGSAHASCTYHFVVHNQLQEAAVNVYGVRNYGGDGPKHKYKPISRTRISHGLVYGFSESIKRPANKEVRIAVEATKGEAVRDEDGVITNLETFKASSSESCYTSGQKKQAGNPVTITIK